MKPPRVIAVVAVLGWAPGVALAQSSPPAMPGMTGSAIEHPPTAPPFYRERTLVPRVPEDYADGLARLPELLRRLQPADRPGDRR